MPIYPANIMIPRLSIVYFLYNSLQRNIILSDYMPNQLTIIILKILLIIVYKVAACGILLASTPFRRRKDGRYTY